LFLGIESGYNKKMKREGERRNHPFAFALSRFPRRLRIRLGLGRGSEKMGPGKRSIFGIENPCDALRGGEEFWELRGYTGGFMTKIHGGLGLR
jgi:hypothetical protein